MAARAGVRAEYTRLPVCGFPPWYEADYVDKTLSPDHCSVMRPIPVLLIVLGLSACSGGPRSLGITGPGPQGPPLSAPPAGMGDLTDYGVIYEPAIGETNGGGRFWGYN
jgi:hypothetical protein